MCAQKLNQMCQKTEFFNFLKYGDSVMYTLQLLFVFISMLDKFKNFNAGQKTFTAKNWRIYNF